MHGSHAATSHLVPALLPPHRKTTNSRLPAMATLCFVCGTRRVSQRATGLPIKFVQKVGRDSVEPHDKLLRLFPNCPRSNLKCHYSRILSGPFLDTVPMPLAPQPACQRSSAGLVSPMSQSDLLLVNRSSLLERFHMQSRGPITVNNCRFKGKTE